MAITKTDQMGTSSGEPAPAEGLACVFLDKVASDFDLPHGGGTPGTWNIYSRLTDTCLGLVEGEGPIVKVFRPLE